jgi:tRNA (guanosine-2'-O-)-methyltransferase
VEKEKFDNVSECYDSLKKKGFTIYASAISNDAVDFYKLDFKKKIAIVLGNEHRGVSDEAIKSADKKFKIPMFGMVQSLNVSVAAAIVLYEALRQRMKKGLYEKSVLNKIDLEELIEKWSRK